MMNETQLRKLRQAVENALGHDIATPRDFEHLNISLQKRLGMTLSVSTLKRLWGYVDNDFTPSAYSLNLLSQFVGYRNWREFTTERPDVSPSDPIMTQRINVLEELTPGDRMRLVWPPDRECLIRYLGSLRFIVEESKNTRLQQDDTFACGLMIAGEPLYLDDLRHDKRQPTAYVCGQMSGIRFERLNP